jgi:hypothetical protein
MSDQPNSQATNVTPRAGQQSNVLSEENWEARTLPYEEDVAPLGFLQLCADRRFHSVIQAKFQEDAGLGSPDDYWIHADAGGTPKMECQRTAPDYCYYDKGVQLMGWSAHGAVCGGFGPNVPDEAIEQALLVVARRKMEEYPRARHFTYFVTIKKEQDTEGTVVYSLTSGTGSD